MIKNLFGNLGLDSTLKRILNTVSRFSFDTSSNLRVSGSISLNSNQTLTTVTTVSTANVSVGDTGKQNTVINNSVQNLASTRRNWK